MRRTLSRFTSPFFVPLRRLIVWLDDKVGTCDQQLVLQPRACFLDYSKSDPTGKYQQQAKQISELERKVSKDKANIVGLGERASDDGEVGC